MIQIRRIVDKKDAMDEEFYREVRAGGGWVVAWYGGGIHDDRKNTVLCQGDWYTDLIPCLFHLNKLTDLNFINKINLYLKKIKKYCIQLSPIKILPLHLFFFFMFTIFELISLLQDRKRVKHY